MLDFINELDNQTIETEICDNFHDYFRMRLDNENRTLGVIHFNIRSLRKHMDELLVYIQMAKDSLDIIVLSETRIIDSVSNFTIPNYTQYYNESTINKCDGTMIYIKNNISADVTTVKINDSRFLRATFTTNHLSKQNKIGLTAYYRPPATNSTEYIDDLENYLSTLNKKNIEILIGDININLLNINSNETNKYLNILGSNDFISYINKPTRVNKDTKSAIDHIFIRTETRLKNNISISPIIFCTDMTDHFTPFVNFTFSETKNQKTPKQNKIRQNIHYKKLNSLLSTETWESILLETDPQKSYDIFISKLVNHIKSSTSDQQLKNSKSITKIKPWISTGLVNSIKHRDNLKKQLLKEYSTELESEYKTYRNKLNSLLKNTKNDYYKTQINQAGPNYKKIWNIINSIRGGDQKNNIENNDIILERNIRVSNNTAKSNEFNKFFVDIGKNMSQKIPKTNLPKIFLSDIKVKQSLFLDPITKNEMVIIIANLKNNSAPGPDRINAKTLKTIHVNILMPLVHIINQILSTGVIPWQWKIANVTPIFKAGKKSQINNYRPISIINTLAKVFEQCVKKRLLEFLDKHHIVTDRQFGFVKNSNTENAIMNFLENTVKAMDKSTKCLAVFLDLAKAFDTVDHDLLMEKLHNYGIRGNAYVLMKNYLSNRIQRVKIGDEISEDQIVKTGIPQGTVLGPILFLIYINSITKLNNFVGDIICYADDTVLIYKGPSWQEIRHIAETNLQKIYLWLNINKLSLNVDKTKYLTFSPTLRDQPKDFNLKMHTPLCNNHNTCDCQTIDHPTSTKYLGVIIDQHLKWTEHINFVTKRLRVLMHTFYELRDILSKKNIVVLYTSLAESIIKYCIPAWGATFKAAINPLQTAQNILLRIIFKKNRLFSTKKLYQETNIFNIHSLYTYNCLIRMFHTQKDYTQNHLRETRSKMNLDVQTEFFNKSVTQNSFLYYGPKIYNILPKNLKDIKTLKIFKKEIKKYVQNHPDRFPLFD